MGLSCFVLPSPGFKLTTVLLWSAPALVLLVGGGGIMLALRRRPSPVVKGELDEAERKKLESLLGKDAS